MERGRAWGQPDPCPHSPSLRLVKIGWQQDLPGPGLLGAQWGRPQLPGALLGRARHQPEPGRPCVSEGGHCTERSAPPAGRAPEQGPACSLPSTITPGTEWPLVGVLCIDLNNGTTTRMTVMPPSAQARLRPLRRVPSSPTDVPTQPHGRSGLRQPACLPGCSPRALRQALQKIATCFVSLWHKEHVILAERSRELEKPRVV